MVFTQQIKFNRFSFDPDKGNDFVSIFVGYINVFNKLKVNLGNVAVN